MLLMVQGLRGEELVVVHSLTLQIILQASIGCKIVQTSRLRYLYGVTVRRSATNVWAALVMRALRRVEASSCSHFA